jgi:[CysO sulfur-carrier protein]-S-L-cysteine hydrolase
MLEISREFADAILEQSRAEYPDECCGVILGPVGSGKASRLKPMINAAHSPTFYEFDSKDLLALYREIDDNDEEIVVIYHSHTETEAHPSRTDIAYASEPNAHYVLVSTRKEIAPATEFRSFRIVDGSVSEEEVSITE